MTRIGHVLCTFYLLILCSADFINDQLSSKLMGGMEDDFKRKSTIEVLATKGETIVLPCNPAAHKYFNSDSSVNWFKDGIAVENSGRIFWKQTTSGFAGSHQRQNYNIRIRNVQNQDGGIWQCQQISDDSTREKLVVSQPILLIIASIPSQPRLKMGDKEYTEASVITLNEDTEVSVKCVVRNANPPSKSVEWFLDKVNVTLSSRLNIEREDDRSTYATFSVLKFRVTRQHHNKALHCQFHHPLWTTSSPSIYVILHVVYKPSFVLSRSPDFGIPIIEETSVSLHCKINSNPPSLPYWVKDVVKSGAEANGTFPVTLTGTKNDGEDGSYMNFSSISRQDVGWYRCSTDHQLGHFTSFGYFLSVRHAVKIVSSSPMNVEAELGDDVLLECGATGSPAPSYCWSRIRGRHKHHHRHQQQQKNKKPTDSSVKQNTTPRNQHFRLESLGLEQNLMLDRLLYSDSGIYKCTASNTVGLKDRHAHSHDIKLNVKGRPIVDPVTRAVRVIKDRPASLSAIICSNPAPSRVHWIVADKALTSKSSIQGYKVIPLETEENQEKCYMSSLEIERIAEEDCGEILVVASNSKGIDQGVILVNLTAAGYSKSGTDSLIRYHFAIIIISLAVISSKNYIVSRIS